MQIADFLPDNGFQQLVNLNVGHVMMVLESWGIME